jgi:hypothetical protein
VVQTLRRAASDALNPRPLQTALRKARQDLKGQLTCMGRPASTGLLEGTSGILLAQNDLSQAGIELLSWDACLLLTL